jgi:hypothetical protein
MMPEARLIAIDVYCGTRMAWFQIGVLSAAMSSKTYTERRFEPSACGRDTNAAKARVTAQLGCGGFFVGLVPLTDPAFDFQLVRRGIGPEALAELGFTNIGDVQRAGSIVRVGADWQGAPVKLHIDTRTGRIEPIK